MIWLNMKHQCSNMNEQTRQNYRLRGPLLQAILSVQQRTWYATGIKKQEKNNV